MADFNLIGEDQTRLEGEDNNEQEFQESYDAELNEPTPSSYLSGGQIDETDYTKTISRGGSKKLVYILAACSVILLAAVAWFILQPSKNKRSINEPPSTALAEKEATMLEDTSKPLNATPAINPIPTPSLSPGLRDRIGKSHHGITTVNNIINTIPSDVNFTMISYSDGTFLVDFLAGGDADINNVNSQLQQNLYSADVKLLSKENRTVQNRQFRHALINGSVNINQGGGELTNLQEPAYLSSAELQSRMTQISQQTGLTIKQFDPKREKAEGEFMILPILFKARGQKGNILSFLQQLNSANLNISFAKIVLIADDAELNNPDITLLLNIGLYRVI
jgi:hypothetical protein